MSCLRAKISQMGCQVVSRKVGHRWKYHVISSADPHCPGTSWTDTFASSLLDEPARYHLNRKHQLYARLPKIQTPRHCCDRLRRTMCTHMTWTNQLPSL